MKIVFTGGGTGGHIYPALAIRDILAKKYEFESAYLGRKESLEEKIVSRHKDIKFVSVKAKGMPRKLSFDWFAFAKETFSGAIDAMRFLREYKPDLVVATGSYVSFPVLAAAKLLGINYVIHEQNAVMGVTNKQFVKGAKKVLLTYELKDLEKNSNVILTGNPVRKEFFANPDDSVLTESGIEKKPGETVLFAVGGSQGAATINKVCLELAEKFLPQNPDFKLIHVSGEKNYGEAEKILKKLKENSKGENYFPFSYLHNIRPFFDIADIVISRAGATFLSELAVCGKPAILIPFPHATANHQEKNAQKLVDTGAAKMIKNEDLTYESLLRIVNEINNPEQLIKMGSAMKGTRPANVENKILEALGFL
ncbi:MAG: undecaprenyldiphospho-muramoylpentapeptide beta-N-acetylglucosaminyltransferase [Candidatus Riflebacteria bacterium]|nr:undecaprenyldiphospho-muramoylpentapeptide beta-N-acetylglucosaminyltransferase [Candidatus Riflebacteria bacterium]